MKKGKVISLTLSHKNGKTVLRAGNPVTENDVNNFDDLVKSGHIELSASDKKAKAAESKKAEEAKEAAESKKAEE